MCRKAPCMSKVRGKARPWVLLLPEAFTLKSILAEGCMCTLGEGPMTGQIWKKKPDTWPEGRQRLEKLTYVNDLTASLLHSSSLREIDVHTLSLQVCIFALFPSQLNKQFLSICSPTCYYAVSLIINCVPAFTVSTSVINAFFTGDKDPGKNSFQTLTLAGVVARIPGSKPGSIPCSMPGQGIKILLHATAHCCSEINLTF